ncbi:MAG: zinc ribbon domain-containing protein [bacterium]
MPIYEYTCHACQKTFEHLARTLSDKPKECPACGNKKKLVKQFSSFAAPQARPLVPSGCHGCAGASCCPSLSQGGCH